MAVAMVLSAFTGALTTLAANISPVKAVRAYYATIDGDTASQQEWLKALILGTGMKESQLAGGPEDNEFYNYIEFARIAGFFDNEWEFDATAQITLKEAETMAVAMTNAYNGLYNAINTDTPAPYFVNGMAVPIFEIGDPVYNEEEGVARFVVYVETNYDTDLDGKLDLIKTFVQLPREAVDEGMKVSTIYEARPYVEGTNGSVHTNSTMMNLGSEYLANNVEGGVLTHDMIHATPDARVPAGETNTKAMVENADYLDWYYTYTYQQSRTELDKATVTYETGTENCFENLDWYDYYLSRGFAFVTTAGIGTLDSDGISTYGADIELDAYRCVIEWLTGDRKAYTNKTDNIEIKATEWSNGSVGMNGRSYAGGTQFALATSGVKGLKAIVPVAGTASYYDYQNSQGRNTGNNNYTPGMAYYVNSRLGSADWESVLGWQAAYMQQMLRDHTANHGDYDEFWARREYSVDGWYVDRDGLAWGTSQINVPMLIVHGANDDNVRPKQSIIMYNAAKEAGVPVKILWNQGEHMTPTFPRSNPNAALQTTGNTLRPHGMYVGTFTVNGKQMELTYDQVLNLWFSHWLYDVDNDVMNVIPAVLAQDNDIVAEGNGSNGWVGYDSWEAFETRYITSDANVAKEGAEGNIVTLSSASAASLNLDNLNAPTDGSIVYAIELPEDFTVKGVVEVNIRAAIESLGATTAAKNLGMHVTLAEVPKEANTLHYYGSSSVGSSPVRTMIQQQGAMIGGGSGNFNLVRFTQTLDGAYRQIAKGWFDLCNPEAGFEAYTADVKDAINPSENIGVYHDYKVYLQPTIHSAKAGNKLVALITFGASRPSSTGGDAAYTVNVDLNNTYVALPAAYESTLGTTSVPGKLVVEDEILANANEGVAVNVAFENEENSNITILTYTYDAEQFAYGSFVPAEGVTVLDEDTSVPGVVEVKLMKADASYGMKGLGELVVTPLADGGKIAVDAEYVELTDDGKVVRTASENTTIVIRTVPENLTLIDLSNLVDWFGYDAQTEGWKKEYRYWDFDNSGVIDIYDISFVASKILA